MEKKVRKLAVGAVALLAAGTLWAVWAASRPPEPLVLYGNVDIRQVNLGFRVAGRLQSLAFDEGDAVPAGAVLARLDEEPYRHAEAEAEANVAAAQARVAQMKAGYRQEEVAQAAAAVTQRQAAWQDAEAALARQQALRGTGAAAARNYDDALSARDQARAQLAAAQAQYAQYRRGYRQEDRDAAQAALKQAEALLASARLQRSDTQLKAPQGGVVLTRAAEPGTILAAGSTLFTLSLGHPVWVRAYVAEPDLGRVAPGTAVKVVTDGRADRPYRGVIGYVSPSAEFTPKNVETPDLRTGLVYRLRVVVSDPDTGLRQGMPVTVRLADGR
ncbi:secretion protein HlyD [Paludibacterium purpuratum]|uniref:HlyD family secretion protein n=1 Tax=Paludibacterium purpuratum TaxID=1144873 RepID=A0A4R7B513_9NEIS|nr:secretion protein HlyD [Paludibacterium purpuratum]TDR79744.1 HlyD family secretion protein [Paludibacterium purpuratum]